MDDEPFGTRDEKDLANREKREHLLGGLQGRRSYSIDVGVHIL